eukprot:2227939-Alexandrium_andersonii.AAC.1
MSRAKMQGSCGRSPPWPSRLWECPGLPGQPPGPTNPCTGHPPSTAKCQHIPPAGLLVPTGASAVR